MAIIIKTQPAEFMAGYSAIPLRVISDDTTSDNLKYLVNITYLESQYSSDVVVAFENQVYTKITTVADHGYTVGDVILFYNPVTDNYTDTYNVVGVTALDEFIIDLVTAYPIDGTGSFFYKVIPFSLLPDLDYEAKLNLSNVIKDFVTQDFENSNEIYEAPSTLFKYGLTIGTEYQYTFEFEDNFFIVGNTVGFNNTTGTALDVTNSPFKIGDRINIQQDLYEWVYDDNTFATGNLGFISATVDHNFRVGDEINVTGQITEQSYNGATTVVDVVDVKTIRVNKPFNAATPLEGGSIFGVITPTYNTGNATITDIYYDGVLGFVIETNILYDIATPPISGVIKYSDNRLSRFPIETKVDDLFAYNSHYTKQEYGVGGIDFDPYVMQARARGENNISTILTKLGKNDKVRIEKSSNSWLLFHENNIGGTLSVNAVFFDSSGALISNISLDNPNLYNDFYAPIGIDQMVLNGNTTLLVGSALATIQDDVATYKILGLIAGSVISNEITFEVNTECSRFDIYHLCWKDAFGSWLSYPFKFISKDSTEFERKTYYQKEGTFDMTTDTFGYKKEDRGDTTYFNRSRDKMILNSGWVEPFENDIIKDLLGSSSVMVQLPDGTMLGCTVNTNKQEFFKRQSDYLWNYQFEITMARNDNRF